MDKETLFNCLTDHAAPDWSVFDALEIGGCVNVSEDDEETCIEGGYSASEAEFFCIYGHLKEGGNEAITDCETLEQALAVAEFFDGKTGLPVNTFC